MEVKAIKCPTYGEFNVNLPAGSKVIYADEGELNMFIYYCDYGSDELEQRTFRVVETFHNLKPLPNYAQHICTYNHREYNYHLFETTPPVKENNVMPAPLTNLSECGILR